MSKKNQLLNYYILPEIKNKLIINLVVKKKQSFFVSYNFRFADIRLIKNLIAFELLSGKRPLLKASLFDKKFIVTLQSEISVINLSYLQKSPIIWSKYFSSFNLTELFYNQSLTVRNNQISLTTANQNNKMDLFINSAYLD